jgi:hypothetical protein
VARTDITKLELKDGVIMDAAKKQRFDGGGAEDRYIVPGVGFAPLNECKYLDGAEAGETKYHGYLQLGI